jgi:hypothetical protein
MLDVSAKSKIASGRGLDVTGRGLNERLYGRLICTAEEYSFSIFYGAFKISLF